MLRELGQHIGDIFKRRDPRTELQKDIENENHREELTAQYMEGEITLYQYTTQLDQLPKMIDLRRITNGLNRR
jgi:signal recognition particle GTPase